MTNESKINLPMNTAYIFENLIPSQGNSIFNKVTKKVDVYTRHEAMVLFENAKKRLTDINGWNDVCHKLGTFMLTDHQGELLQSAYPKVGNLIRIKLFSSTTPVSNKYEWVRIESFGNERNLLQDKEVFSFCVKPVSSPFSFKDESSRLAHSGMTTTFYIIRKGSIVTASQTETQDGISSEKVSVFNKMKEMILSLSPSISFSKPQWKGLLQGVLQY